MSNVKVDMNRYVNALELQRNNAMNENALLAAALEREREENAQLKAMLSAAASNVPKRKKEKADGPTSPP
jgi:hypothetical protein